MDISDFPTRHNYGLALRQKHVERILAGWVNELAVPIYRSRELAGFSEDDIGVSIELSDGVLLRASYLVGCDGGRSLVRKIACIEFPGWDATTSNILAVAEMAVEPPLGVHRTAFGIHAFGREKYEIRGGKVMFATEGPINVMVTEKDVGATTEPTLQDLREALVATCGTDYGIHNLTWISRFTDVSRQAATWVHPIGIFAAMLLSLLRLRQPAQFDLLPNQNALVRAVVAVRANVVKIGIIGDRHEIGIGRPGINKRKIGIRPIA